MASLPFAAYMIERRCELAVGPSRFVRPWDEPREQADLGTPEVALAEL